MSSNGLAVAVEGSTADSLPSNSNTSFGDAGRHPDVDVSATEGLDVRPGVLAAVVDGPAVGSPPMRLSSDLSSSVGNDFVDIPSYAAWSPGGSMIAVRKGRTAGYGFELYVVNRDGTGRRDLVKGSRTEEGQYELVPAQDLSHNSLDREVPLETGRIASLRQVNIFGSGLGGCAPGELPEAWAGAKGLEHCETAEAEN